VDDREYDAFEVYPNHSVKWHGRIRGTERALEKLEELRQATLNECFAAHIGTLEIIGRVNEGGAVAQTLNDDEATPN
jgi:hypothetical protein